MPDVPFSIPGAAGEFLQTLIHTSSAGAALFDRKIHYLALNATHALANGRHVEEHAGQSLETMAPSLAFPLTRLLRKVFEEGQALQGQRVIRDVPGQPGQLQTWTVDLLPVPGASGEVAAACVLFTPADLRSAQAPNHVPERLWDLTLTLPRAQSVEAVVNAVMEEAVPLTGAVAAGMSLLNEERTALKVLGATGYDASTLHAWPSVPLTLNIPATTAVNEARTLFLTESDLRSLYPDLAVAPTYAGMAHVALPLVDDDTVLGCLTLAFPNRSPFTPSEQRVMTALAATCAGTITALHRRAAEQAARQELERTAAFLNSVMNGAPSGIAFVDLKLRFIQVNAAFAEQTGHPVTAHPGARWGDVVPGWAAITQALAITRQTRQGSRQTVTASRPGGAGDQVMEMEVTPVLTLRGELLALKCSVTPLSVAAQETQPSLP
ncbi:PAS domain-containing protein (plasmid) [Deinococcus taeanensis]|uniref:PAS domain-containing protein n=1 Tax=Deinococcus taeanensis TaxID=2737050 RepID=UPI001CDCF73F|nr:PAS domain-containing protein [Deinococcus taeanensis]UBV45418.1 PAS domain-containing protein [Deinococcus taeanensis]